MSSEEKKVEINDHLNHEEDSPQDDQSVEHGAQERQDDVQAQILHELIDTQDFLRQRIDAMNKKLRSFDEESSAKIDGLKAKAEAKLKNDFMSAMLNLQDEIDQISTLDDADIDESLRSLVEGVRLTHKGALQAAGVNTIQEAITVADASSSDSPASQAPQSTEAKPKPKKARRRPQLGAIMASAQNAMDPFKGLDSVKERVQNALNQANDYVDGDEVLSSVKDELEEAFETFSKLERNYTQKTERFAKEQENAELYGAEKLAKKFIEVVDNMDRALQATATHKDNDNVKGLYQGVADARDNLVQAFAVNGIERDDPLGEKLNPHFHQAVTAVPQEGAAKDEIINVAASGYVMRKERVLRPAMVVVAS